MQNGSKLSDDGYDDGTTDRTTAQPQQFDQKKAPLSSGFGKCIHSKEGSQYDGRASIFFSFVALDDIPVIVLNPGNETFDRG